MRRIVVALSTASYVRNDYGFLTIECQSGKELRKRGKRNAKAWGGTLFRSVLGERGSLIVLSAVYVFFC
jgi:hypothetical protein